VNRCIFTAAAATGSDHQVIHEKNWFQQVEDDTGLPISTQVTPIVDIATACCPQLTIIVEVFDV